MEMKKYALGLVLSLFLFKGWSQSSVTSTTVDLVERTPSSPTAGGLGKYFDFPVNMATGIPAISIPLYTVQTGGITVPIALKYNAGGVKVSERAGWVGTGWSLEAGGSINKRVNGYDDVYATGAAPSGTSGPQYNYVNPDYSGLIEDGFTTLRDIVDSALSSTYVISNLENLRRFFGRIALGQVDGEADEYYFSNPQGGGTFFYNQKESAFISNKPDGTSIMYNPSSSDSIFWITNKEGIFYDYGIKERVVNPIYKKSMGSAMKYLTNTWHLSGITDPQSGKSVSFNYDNYYSDVITGQTMYVDYKYVSPTPQYMGGNITDIEREGDEYSISAIYFTEGKVLFVKDTANRLDGGTKALREILVYNNRNILLKRIKLDYFYLTSDTSTRCTTAYNRLFLSTVREIEFNGNGDSLIKEPYKLTYKNDVKLPCAYSYAFDHWGFYNGKTNNTTTLPTIAGLTSLGIPTQSNKDIDTAYTQSGILKVIQYPTGGTTSFEYEYNRTDTIVGGLRVKKIIHYDSVAGKSIATEYEYKLSNGQSSGQMLNTPKLFYEYYTLISMGNEYFGCRIEGDAISPLFPNQGSPVLYTNVLEKKTGSDGDLRTMHHMTGFWSYTNGGYMNMCCGVPHNKVAIRSDLIGIEHKTELYKKNSTGSYIVAQLDSAVTGPLTDESKYTWNVQAAWAGPLDGWLVWPGNDPYSTNPINLNPSINAYRTAQQSVVKLENHSIIYDESTTLQTGNWYEYDEDNTAVKQTKSVDSNGDTTIALIKYSGDYLYIPGGGSPPSINHEIKQLHDANMKAEPVETLVLLKKKDSTNSTVVSAVLYEYEGLKIKKVYKVFEKIPYASFSVSYNDTNGFYKDSHYQLYQEVTAWDSTVKPKTVITNTNQASYVWDVHFAGPVAAVTNASYEDIAFSSFDGFANGGWTGAATTRDSVYSVTGRKSYQLTWGSVSKGSLTSGKNYIVSYWSRNGSYTVTGSVATVQGRTINGWTYYEHNVTGVSTITVSGSGTSYIDELRLYPKGAQMGTFCYEELLGVTSQCDANNRISYYDYWGPGYLRTIKDEDGRILKRMEYKYQGSNQD